MALSLAYVNEVLNQVDSTILVDEVTYPELLRLLKFEDRAEDLERLMIGRMRIRMARGGYAGLLKQVDALLTENAALRQQLEEATAPPVVGATESHGG